MFIHSFNLFIHSIHSFTHLFMHSFNSLFVRLFIYSIILAVYLSVAIDNNCIKLTAQSTPGRSGCISTHNDHHITCWDSLWCYVNTEQGGPTWIQDVQPLESFQHPLMLQTQASQIARGPVNPRRMGRPPTLCKGAVQFASLQLFQPSRLPCSSSHNERNYLQWSGNFYIAIQDPRHGL